MTNLIIIFIVGRIFFIIGCAGVILTLWGAVELAIAAERDRVEWMKQYIVRRNREWLDRLIMSVR